MEGAERKVLVAGHVEPGQLGALVKRVHTLCAKQPFDVLLVTSGLVTADCSQDFGDQTHLK